MKLNETPIRTSRNFGINNITLDNVEIPDFIKEFDNIDVTKEYSEIDGNVSVKPLVYGAGSILEENIQKNANSKLKINVTKKDNIEIVYEFDEDNTVLVNQIDINASADCNIIIQYKSNTDLECFHNGIVKVTAQNNSNVNVCILNFLNEKSNNFESFENKCEDNSNLQYTIIDIGGKNSISNYYSNVVGEKAKNVLKTIYLANDNEVKDLNYIVDVRGEKSDVDIDVQGAIDGEAKKHFKGTIDFKKGCTKSKGSENEYCMLLSNKAKSIALPVLLCTEDDVEGNHSTASGKVENKELFYIMSRGLSYKEAIKLIVKARFNNILARIKDEDLRNEIISKIDGRL